MLAAGSLKACHATLNARLHKECAFLEFTQNARALVFLLEAAQRTIDGLVALYGNSDHGRSYRLKGLLEILDQTLFFVLFEVNEERRTAVRHHFLCAYDANVIPRLVVDHVANLVFALR